MKNLNDHDETRENGSTESDDSSPQRTVDHAVEKLPRSTSPLNEDELAQYRIDQTLDDYEHGPKQRTLVVRKPGKSWFRVSPKFGQDGAYAVVEHEGSFYLVAKEVHSELKRSAGLRCFYLCVTPSGERFLWPAPIRTDWATSARRAAEAAKKVFVRLFPEDGQYAFVEAPSNGELALIEPDFPMGSDAQIVVQAFEGRVIASTDHPVAKKLLGWIP